MLQILDPNGRLVGDHDLGMDELISMYRFMVLSREFDRRALALQRQGRIGTYAMLEGQEGAQVGSAMALGESDFVYPSYREHGVQLTTGLPLEVLLAYWKGLPNADWDVMEYRMAVVCVPISSQIAHAVGHAYEERRQGRDTVVAAYFGDGATSGNDFHSGLNFAGVWNTPNVFFCQNNGYAISVPLERQTASESIAAKAAAYGIAGIRVDGMDPLACHVATSEAVDRARRGDGPTLIEAVTYRYGPHATADDSRRYRDPEEEQAWRAKDPIERLRLHLMSADSWSAALDEEIRAETALAVQAAIETIESRPLPGRDEIARHGYSRIPRVVVDELNKAETAHGEAATDFGDAVWIPEEAHSPVGPTRSMTMAEALTDAMAIAMEADPAIVVLGEDVGLSGGVFRVTDGLQARFGSDRVMDTPLNESGIIGSAIGMAVAGGRPIAEIQFDGFVYPGFDQIVSHLGRMRYRTRGNVELPVVVRLPTGAGIGAHEHHCDNPEAYFTHTPGLVVAMPTTPTDAKGMLLAALSGSDPVIFLEPKILYRAGREEVPVESFEIPLGKARVRREGTDVTVVTYGSVVPAALAAAETSGADVEVIDLRTLFPWDAETVLTSISKTGRLVVVHEAPRSSGVGAEIVATVAERAAYSLESPIVRVAGLDAPWPQFAIESHALITPERIVDAIRTTLAA